VDRILRGDKPGELPIEQPVKFDLVVNLQTAKALGLNIPESLPQRKALTEVQPRPRVTATNPRRNSVPITDSATIAIVFWVNDPLV